MAFSDILHLGLPLGNTFLVVAFLELVTLFSIFIRELGIVLLYMYYDADLHLQHIGMEIAVTVFKTAATIILLWIGSVFLGNSRMLIAWIMATIAFALYYFVLVIVFGSQDSKSWPEYVYTLIIVSIMYAFEVTIGIWTWQAMKRGDREILQPIGKGILYLWEYFCNDLLNAAKFFLITEMVLDVQYLLLRQVLLHIFGSPVDVAPSHPAILTEQLIMTIIRLVIDGVGLYFVMKEKKGTVRLWCLAAAIQILVSSALFVLLTVVWRGEDLIDSVQVFLMYPVHLLFRCLVLFFALRYTHVQFSSMVL